MTFGNAIEHMKQGSKVARKGWNGKGMWIALGNGGVVKSENFWNANTKQFAEQNGGEAEVLPYLIMKTSDDKILMGWLASQSDILSEDWEVVK